MHPLLARRPHLALYLLLWAVIGTLLGAWLAGQHDLRWTFAAAVALPLAGAFSFVCLSAWYVARGQPLAGSPPWRVAATALAAAVVSSGVWALLARGWVGVLSRRAGAPLPDEAAEGVQTLLFGAGVLLYLLALAVSHLLTVLEASQAAARRQLQVQVLAREAELRSLRAQIDPHFLFNSLHSISALTAADPPGARRMCLLLAEFLRETLALGAEARIPLSRELALIERFLAIERVRFGDRLAAEISAGDAGACPVPPLLLQPLVENAVTHGIAHLVEGGVVRIAARRAGGAVRIVIENPCDEDAPAGHGAGVGLANVRARLRAVYGPEAAIAAGRTDAGWRVDLTVPGPEGIR